jgi:hypothetical protein
LPVSPPGWDDGSFDSTRDPHTGTASKCGGAGGTWFEPSDFANRGLGDWNPNGNADLAQEIANMQAGDPGSVEHRLLQFSQELLFG